MKRHLVWGCLFTAAGGLACEPASVTEARDILGRNGGVVSFRFPITDTTYLVSDLLAGSADTTVTNSGVLGVRVQADTLSAFTFTDQLRTTETSTTVAFPTPGFGAPGSTQDTVRFVTGQGSSVVSATVQLGYVVRTITNTTGCTGSAGSTVVDSVGNTVVTFANASVASGVPFVDSVSVAGVTLVGFADISATGSILGGCIPNPGGRVSSVITVRVLTLSSVTLDNVNESISVEQGLELVRSELGLDDLEDAVLDATLNEAIINLTIVNSADIPTVVSNFYIVAVQVDGTGNLMRDGMNNLIFETDGTGARLEALIADSGLTTLTVGRQATTSVSIQAAGVVDRMVDLLIQNQRVALVAIGDATAGDGTRSTLTSTDDVEVQFDVVIGLDFTIPSVGITLNRNQTAEGMDLDSADIDQIANRVVTAGLSALVQNSTPFGVEIQIALAPDSLDETVDIFTRPGAVILSPVIISAPPTDAAGVPTATASDSITLAIVGTDIRVVLDSVFTAGIRFRLLPRTGGGTRGAIVPTAGVRVDASVLVELRRGTGGGS